MKKKRYNKKEYKRWHNKTFRCKKISKSPENGRTVDVVDMIERNEERFNYGLELNC